jgi:hypothetical protein
VHDTTDRFYCVLRFAATADVAVITTANPSTPLRLFDVGQRHVERLLDDLRAGTCRPPGEDLPDQWTQADRPRPDVAERIDRGLERDGRLRPTHLWDDPLLNNWTGGTLHLYLPRLRELFGRQVVISDIGLLASEGRFSVPLESGTPAGPAEITRNVIEFLPAEQYGSDQPDVVPAWQADVGQEYFLVVSNAAGLFRYSLGDRVRVTGRRGTTPEFEFLSRGLHTASITGEKITEHQVVEAMRQTAAELNLRIERFVLQGRFDDPPFYELQIEPPEGCDSAKVAVILDRVLSDLNIEYESKRSSGRLGPVRPVVLRPGQLEQAEQDAIARRRGRSEQYKHQYLRSDVLSETPAQPE